jgi:restriction system protein
MKPILSYTADKNELPFREITEHLVQQFSLTETERKELLPSGRTPIFDNRVGWALYYLKRAGLLEGMKRGYYRITQESCFKVLS